MFGLHRFVCQEVLGNKLSGFYVGEMPQRSIQANEICSLDGWKGGKFGGTSNRTGQLNIIVATLPPWKIDNMEPKNHEQLNLNNHLPKHLHFIWLHLPFILPASVVVFFHRKFQVFEVFPPASVHVKRETNGSLP